MRVLHYVNQFFGGIGGEDKADARLELRRGPVGPGILLQRFLGGNDGPVEILTIVAGDTYAAENIDEVVRATAGIVEAEQPSILVAGPAFFAGRYGLVCGELATRIPTLTGIPAITGMYEENPAVGLFRSKALIVQTGPSATSMTQTMERIVRLIPRLIAGETIPDPGAEGLFATGVRRNARVESRGADRAVDLLLSLLKDGEAGTELAIPDFESVSPAEPVPDLSEAVVALVTEGGLVPIGNPDHLSTGASERWGRYRVQDLLDDPGSMYSIHGGYDTEHVNASPFRLVPADALSQLVEEGRVGQLHPYYYVTSGTATAVENCRMMGAQIAQVLLDEGVTAVVFTST